MGEAKRRGRKPNLLKGLSTLELRALEMQINNQIRQRRIRVVLKALASMKEKAFNIRRFEADLSEGIDRHNVERIDGALDMLEILLDIEIS